MTSMEDHLPLTLMEPGEIVKVRGERLGVYQVALRRNRISSCPDYLSLNPSWTANPARMTANPCWMRFTAREEFARYALTPLARIP